MSVTIEALMWRTLNSTAGSRSGGDAQRTESKSAQNGNASASDGSGAGRQVSEKPDVIVSLSASITNPREDDQSEEASKTQKQAEIERWSREKGRAREALIRIAKQLKITKNLFELNPKGMAKALAGLVSQMKDMLNDFKKAQKELAKIQGSAGGDAGMSMPAMPDVSVAGSARAEAPEDVKADAEASDAAEQAAEQAEGVEDEGAEAGTPPEDAGDGVQENQQDAQSDQAPAQNGRMAAGFEIYQKAEVKRVRLDHTDQAVTLKGDIDFIKEVKGLFQKIKDEFAQARRVAIGTFEMQPDKDEDFKVTDKAIKDLDKELNDYHSELQNAMPPAIYVDQPA